jgi:hypothetical protein
MGEKNKKKHQYVSDFLIFSSLYFFWILLFDAWRFLSFCYLVLVSCDLIFHFLVAINPAKLYHLKNTSQCAKPLSRSSEIFSLSL